MTTWPKKEWGYTQTPTKATKSYHLICEDTSKKRLLRAQKRLRKKK